MTDINLQAYDLNSSPLDNVLSADGLQFDYDKPFFLIANIPIKNKTMFEITISDYYPINNIYHIPLYVGISREPSMGVLIADYAVSSLFYDVSDPKYEILSNELPDNAMYIDGSSTDADGDNTIGTRQPGIGDTIGVAVNYNTNTIELYVNYSTDYPYDGEYDRPFYSYTPPFNLSEQPNMYFCLYSNISYKEIEEDYNYRDLSTNELKHISGYVNFGKYGLAHPVSGYSSLYKTYYTEMASSDFSTELGSDDDPCFVYIGGDEFTSYSTDMDSNLTIENELEPEASNIKLITDDPEFITTDGNKYYMNANTYIKADYDYTIGANNKYGITNSYKVGGNIYINYPIPTNEKIYFEYIVKNAELKKKIVGIPVAMGLTSIPLSGIASQTNATNPNTIMNESIRVNLYRGNCFIENGLDNTGGYYLYHLIRNSVQNSDKNELHYLETVETTSTPEQGKVIGVALDLENNNMDIYIDGEKLSSLNLKNVIYNTDFSNFNMNNNKTEYVYFFIHDEGVFSSTATGTFNFGQNIFDQTIPDGYTSLYDFYNVDSTRLITKDMDSSVYINATKSVNKFIDSYVCINTAVNSDYEGWNDLIQSDNYEDDIFAHYFEFDTEGMSNMQKLISNENAGLVLTHKETSLNVDFAAINNYKVYLTKYDHQRLLVTYNNRIYTLTKLDTDKQGYYTYLAEDRPYITVPEYTTITVDCEAVDDIYKYTAGTPSVSKAIVTSDIILTATNATYKEYNVIINQSQNQTILVYNMVGDYLIPHTSSFVLSSRYPVIIPWIFYVAEGYTAGKLNLPEQEEYTVTEDTIVYSTAIQNIKYTITIMDTSNEVITVISGGKTYTNANGVISFTCNYNDYCKASIKANDGYISGNMYFGNYDKESDTFSNKQYFATSFQVNDNFNISADEAKVDEVYINIDSSEANNASISVINADKVSDGKYKAIRNNTVVVNTKPASGYYFDHYEIKY